MYNDDTDTWTVQQYNKLGYGVKAFIKKGKIWAVVKNYVSHSLMSYDDVDNVWITCGILSWCGLIMCCTRPYSADQ